MEAWPLVLVRVSALLGGLGLLGGCGDDASSESSAGTEAQTTASAGTGGVAGQSPGGAGGGTAGAGGEPAPWLVLPEVIALPYVLAGAGGSASNVEVQNQGAADTGSLTWTLTGSTLLTLSNVPPSVAADSTASLSIAFAGAPDERIETATLAVTGAEGSIAVPVFAATGDPALGQGSWATVTGAGGVNCGEGITVAMPTAPFPHGGAPYDDPSVRVFLPEGFRDRGAQDLVVHFHGHNTTLAETLSSHRYERHLYASGANAVLVVPQGPINAASGDFGKLMDAGGLEALLREVLVLLYREGRIQSPALGDLALTSHSGGYVAVATNLEPDVCAEPVGQVDLFDSMYAYESTYVGYAVAGGKLRSNYTSGGGTLDNNQTAMAMLESDGLTPATEATELNLLHSPALIYWADTSHSGSTRLNGAYGEQLRWGLRHHRHGPRIELRRAVAQGGSALVTWLAPHDSATTGFRVEVSSNGTTYTTAAQVPVTETQAAFAWTGSGRVRVVPIVSDLDPQQVLASDVYAMDNDPQILVVDAFDRILDGSYGGLSHDFAAIVGQAAGPVATVSNEAITEEGFALDAWPTVIWLTGDESTADRSISADEQDALSAYVAGGGRLIASGSEIGFELSGTQAGRAFLADVFGADFALDDSGSYTVGGVGALAGVGSFSYAGPGAPYVEDYPDAFDPANGAQTVLEYGSGQGAGVGISAQAVLIGFPLELIDDPADRMAVLGALVGFVGG
jgi:hypothetical protein